MATQEKKLEIWRALSRQMGCPPKDSDEYFQKTEAYYHILEELNAQDTYDQPPPQRPRGVCYCDCHRTGGPGEAASRPPEPMRRHKVTRCDTSDSDSDNSFESRVPSRASPRSPPKEKEKDKRGRGRPRKVVSESESESEEEEIKPKRKASPAKKKPGPKKDTKKSNTKRSSR